MFPKNKVFATRFGCQDGEPERIDYTNVRPNWGFMAIYAGTNKQEADAFLEAVKREGRFRGANLRGCLTGKNQHQQRGRDHAGPHVSR